jgi:hypothetical protein
MIGYDRDLRVNPFKLQLYIFWRRVAILQIACRRMSRYRIVMLPACVI